MWFRNRSYVCFGFTVSKPLNETFQQLPSLINFCCLLQLWYILASFVTWYPIDRVGRRFLPISMAIGMCVVLVAEAVCVAISNAGTAIGAVFFVFAFEALFYLGLDGLRVGVPAGDLAA
jgi:hypothetical protein